MVRILGALLFLALLSRLAFASGVQIPDTIFLLPIAVAGCIIVPGIFAKGWIDRAIIAGMVLLCSIIGVLATLDMSPFAIRGIIYFLSVGLPVLGLVIALCIISIRGKQRGTGRRT